MDEQIKTLDNTNSEDEIMMKSQYEVASETTDDNKNLMSMNDQKIKFALDDLYTETQPPPPPPPPLLDNEPTNM